LAWITLIPLLHRKVEIMSTQLSKSPKRGFRAQPSSIVAAIAAFALAGIAGCSGTGNAGGSAGFVPATQTLGEGSQSLQRQSPLAIIDAPCLNPSVPKAVSLGSAATFAVLGGSEVRNMPGNIEGRPKAHTVLNGDLGVIPGNPFGKSIIGFPPGVVHGLTYARDAVAAKAHADLATAYTNVSARHDPIAIPADIGGMTITPGLYAPVLSLGITGNVKLDGQNNPNSVFVFQIGSTLTTSVGSKIILTNDANACNIFWQVGSSAEINAGSRFMGTIMANDSVSLGERSRVRGRVLAKSGTVTLVDDAIGFSPVAEPDR
jgi:hypothetical protein